MAAPPPVRTSSSALPATATASTSTSTSTSSPSPSPSPSAAAAVSQSLASILNNPHPAAASWSLWPSAAPLPDFAPIPASPSPISRADFTPYLAAVSDPHSRFSDIRNHQTSALPAPVPGNALVACLREVPSLFFKSDFQLEDGSTFQSACPYSASEAENSALQERLTQYLDVVEMHLVREIGVRSESFFEAQGQLQGLNGEIVEAVGRIRGLKERIRVLTGNLVGSARVVKELNGARENLVVLQEKLTVILYVSQAMAALKLLVAAGDCAGALDVTDDLQHLLDTDELAGLHCFRHLRDHLAASLDSINSILSAEFLRATIHDAKVVDSMILSNMKTRASNPINGIEDEVTVDDDESYLFRDRLLPLIIGLLRTARLPAVLRIYRDTLVTDMKSAIKATVAELLPVLLGRPSESEQVSGEHTADTEGGLSLASKLKSLSSGSFVLLLIAIFKVVQTHLTRAAEVKRVIEWVMGNLDSYAADSLSTVPSQGGEAYVTGDTAYEKDSLVATQVQHSFPKNTPKIPLNPGKANDGSSPITSRNFRADVLRENTEAVFATCDAAHGRWAKLLSVRALLHPKLRLQEFLSIYDITQEFIVTTEKIGGRVGHSVRGTLSSQSKAFVDYQHESRMTKIKAVLDQETWVAVDVPDEFQAIVASLSSMEASISNDEPVLVNGSSSTVEQPLSVNGILESSTALAEQSTSVSLPVLIQDARSEASSKGKGDGRTDEHGRATSQALVYGGVGYHMVNCGLILFKMLSEYVDISRCLPSLSSEVVHRVVEILKLFNTRTCMLVLGAGAMQVSGLKSITSKHLALASQIIGLVYVMIPAIRRSLFLNVSETRNGVLLTDFDKVAQDYRLHRDEIHAKLVAIMRDRLFINIRKLPQIVASWNGQEDNDLQPSVFARAVTKEVMYLHRILSQTLLEDDVRRIFRQVVQIFHSHITESFSKLDVSTPQARNRLCLDVQHILGCIRKLPSDISSENGVPNFGLLDEFLAEKFGANVGQ